MFSDHYRKIKIIGLIIILGLMAWYSDAGRHTLTLSDCLKDPERYDGSEVPIFMEARIGRITSDHLQVDQITGPVEIFIPAQFKDIIPSSLNLEEIQPGQSMEAITIFRKAGYLELAKLRVAPLRPLKIILSIFPALIVIILLIRSIRYKKGRLVLQQVTKKLKPS